MLKAFAATIFGVSLFAAAPVQSQDYPTREIKLVCGFVAGSGADIIHRYLAKQLSAITGRQVIVENRPGAFGNIAHSYAAKSKPDGYTVYPVGGSALASSLHLFKNPPVDPLNDFEPVGTILKQGWLIAVDAKSPIKSLAELTAAMKAKGAKGSYSTATTTGTVMGELYKAIAGLETVQVNYKTIGDSLNDLLSGNIDYAMPDAAFALANIRNGRIRALGISTGERMKSMPDIPTMTEGGVPGIDLIVWWSTQVPRGTPQPIKDQLRSWFDQILRMKETEDFLFNIGTDVFISTPEATRNLLIEDIKRWGDYVKRAKIQPT